MRNEKTIEDLPLEHQALIRILGDEGKDHLKNEQFKNLDPEKLINLAEKHRLTPVLYNYLIHHHHDFSENVMEQIKKLTREHTMRSLNLQSELLRICTRFDQGHISYMTIKGPQLSHFLYNDGSRRVCVDLDLFLQNRDQFSSAAKILQESGYMRTNYPEDSGRFRKWIFNIGKHESIFVNRSAGTVIDLHIRPVGNTLFSARFHKHFFSEKQPYDMNGRQIYIPSIIHYFIFLCHHGAVHGYSSLHWLADICTFYHRYPLSPGELLKTSEILRLKRHIILSLVILNRYCGIGMSPEVEGIYQRSRTLKKLSNSFHGNLMREKNHIFTLKGRFEKTIYRLRLADGFPGKADLVLSIISRYFYRILKLTAFNKRAKGLTRLD
jgi:hypothetical protein